MGRCKLPPTHAGWGVKANFVKKGAIKRREDLVE